MEQPGKGTETWYFWDNMKSKKRTEGNIELLLVDPGPGFVGSSKTIEARLCDCDGATEDRCWNTF